MFYKRVKKHVVRGNITNTYLLLPQASLEFRELVLRDSGFAGLILPLRRSSLTSRGELRVTKSLTYFSLISSLLFSRFFRLSFEREIVLESNRESNNLIGIVIQDLLIGIVIQDLYGQQKNSIKIRRSN